MSVVQANAGVPAAAARRPFKRWRVLAAATSVIVASVLLIGAWMAPRLLEANRYAADSLIEAEATYHDPSLMAAAWRLPVAEQYRQQSFEYQGNPSFCGPASVANLLRSMGVAASQHTVLEGTDYHPVFGILFGGLTLDQLGDVLRHSTTRPVSVIRGLSLAEFRQELPRVDDPARRYIINFHRGPLFGHGHGHFSPLMGYLPRADLVLVGDVNPAYRPFLVSSERLWEAMDTVDGTSNKKRGLLMVNVD